MSTRGLPVPLDRSIPFVSAVVDVIECRGDLTRAIEVLTAAEQRCGVALWWELAGDDSLLSPGCFVPLNREAPPTLSATQALLHRPYEEFIQVFGPVDEDDPRSAALGDRLMQLLGETHLILAGMDCDNVFARTPDGTLSAWTMRAWGAFLASWANETGWGPHYSKGGQRYSWKYMGFYNLGEETLEQYTRWMEVVHDVLRQKTLRALEE
ncbi:hypothetical protein [Pyxidicoccus xibeiensis]|uniref:hypothetical protein n=1 Tax=Pyxidicoccus xibeiensis TaxID=2906759 RepID=UPI0020A7AA96|nr:hypothetical protein [Pyxidicoccus xibeiensis]MCP3136319.1 hypothetical protein [Pyxidicoccus xibeiensis]